MINRSRVFAGLLCALAFLCALASGARANSSEAFMSLPFGHTWTRTKLRMERTGAVTVTEKRGASLTMKGMFEDREALFLFYFTSRKGLSSKTVNISSFGNKRDDRAFYDALKYAYESMFGAIKERQTVSANNSIALTSLWNPDKYTSIVLNYNPDASRFSENLALDSPIRLSYMTSKWTK